MSTTPSKSKVVVDIKNNRLEFTFADVITGKDLNDLYTDVRFCVADLKEGFDVISDFSHSRVIRLESMPTLRRIMNYLISNKVREVLRIVQDDRLIYKQFLNLALHIPGYKPVYCATRNDALNRLDFFVKRDGIRLNLPNISVEYTFADVRGNGLLMDISVSGCAIFFCANEPAVDEEILLSFPFEHEVTNRLSLQAKVVRSKPGNFAVQFIQMNDENKDQLWKALMTEIQRTKATEK